MDRKVLRNDELICYLTIYIFYNTNFSVGEGVVLRTLLLVRIVLYNLLSIYILYTTMYPVPIYRSYIFYIFSLMINPPTTHYFCYFLLSLQTEIFISLFYFNDLNIFTNSNLQVLFNINHSAVRSTVLVY